MERALCHRPVVSKCLFYFRSDWKDLGPRQYGKIRRFQLNEQHSPMLWLSRIFLAILTRHPFDVKGFSVAAYPFDLYYLKVRISNLHREDTYEYTCKLLIIQMRVPTGIETQGVKLSHFVYSCWFRIAVVFREKFWKKILQNYLRTANSDIYAYTY